MEASLLRTNKEIAEIYSRYADTVYRICFMMLKSAAEAEDAAQTVFVKLSCYKKAFQSEEHVKAWLIVTAQNVCRDLLKSWWKSRRVDADVLREANAAPQAFHEDLLADILRLGAKYKLPLYLYYYEGYRTEEIAQILKINPSTLRTHLRTARKKLKLLIEEAR